ncbi:hypothetical protein JCGZ_02614 [Jatropha curcas]|uniref:Uncharacterized protein n=1 Tax=Jatropha curcas TaxID=180498 RepID=A0A067L674_JATCU|nr:hypothetical protein JCGZ_02614 [Jatropha curcas]
MTSPRRNVLQKFRSVVRKLSHKGSNKISYRSLAEAADGNGDGENNNVAKSPRRARRGCVTAYVGEEAKRYEIPIKFLAIQSFQELIIGSEEEDFDSKIEGPIRLSCSTSFFDEQLQLLKLRVDI